MAYCNQTLSGIQLDCSSSMGGIKKVYIANYDDVKGFVTDEQGYITNITMAEGAKFKPYQFRKQTGSLVSTLNVNEQSGLNYVSTELTLVFTKMETLKRLEMSALSKGQLRVIVEDCNGNFYFLGADDYVSAIEGGGSSGVSKSDSNSYNLKLKEESAEFPYFVDTKALENIIDE